MLGYLCAFLSYFVLEKPLLNIEAHFLKRQGPNKPTSVEPKIPSDGAFKHQILSDTPDPVRLLFDKEQQIGQDMDTGTNAESFSGARDSTELFAAK